MDLPQLISVASSGVIFACLVCVRQLCSTAHCQKGYKTVVQIFANFLHNTCQLGLYTCRVTGTYTVVQLKVDIEENTFKVKGIYPSKGILKVHCTGFLIYKNYKVFPFNLPLTYL